MNIMTVRAPDDLQKKLKEKAENRGLTRNSLILQILWEWVEGHDCKTEEMQEKV
ncbi:MAG: hypothetical protein ACI4AD_04820 [Roseburia sp.]